MSFFVVKESSRDCVLPNGRTGTVGRTWKREVWEARGTLWLSLNYTRWTAISVSLISWQPCLEHSGSHGWPVLTLQGSVFWEVGLVPSKKIIGSHKSHLPAPNSFLLWCYWAHPVCSTPGWNDTQPSKQLTHAPDSCMCPSPPEGWAMHVYCTLCSGIATLNRWEGPYCCPLITHFPSSAAGSWKQFLSPSETHHFIKSLHALRLSSAIISKSYLGLSR